MPKKKEWSEGELVAFFGLTKLIEPTPLMDEWLNVSNPDFLPTEKMLFDEIYQEARHGISTWNEEDLKMKFISLVLRLGKLVGRHTPFVTFFERALSAKVQGKNLSVRCDFVLAKGVMNYLEKPYFHFQEYKPSKNPTGDSMAQLLEAFLIGQTQNESDQPLYGVEVIGKQWTFVILQNKTYCVSKTYDCTEEVELLKIIAILQNFRTILETKLL